MKVNICGITHEVIECDEPTGTYEEMVTFQLGVIATMLVDISKSLATIADKAESEDEG